MGVLVPFDLLNTQKIVARGFVSTLLLLTSLSVGGETIVVSTEQGEIVGVRHGDHIAYKGIPFAQPPLGPLRWQPPQPVAKHDGVMSAADFGPVCMQRRGDDTPPMSEDCLTLNIWTPGADNAKRPVMVWLHGGGFRSGSNRYQGQVFAQRGVVLVALNYRLGPLGIFAHPALDPAVANYGVMDMVQGLQWVQTNIANFGGDPDNVTIFGVSAGGMSVNMMLVAPAAKGLFHRAIAQSAYGTWGLPRTRSAAKTSVLNMDLSPADSAEEISIKVVERVVAQLSESDAGEQVDQSDRLRRSRVQTAASLRQLPADKLVRAYDGFYLPVVDGVTLPEEPALLLANGQHHGVPVIMGGNDYEGSVQPYSGISIDFLKTFYAGKHDQVRALYAADFAVQESLGWQRLFGDTRYVVAARLQAAHLARQDNPAWLFYMTYIPPTLRDQWAGSVHGFDSYVLTRGKTSGDPAMAKLSERMLTYWVNMARHGDPNSDGVLAWPTYKPTSEEWMVFGEQDEVRQKVISARLDFIEAHYRERTGAKLTR